MCLAICAPWLSIVMVAFSRPMARHWWFGSSMAAVRLTAFPTSDGPRGSARTMSFRGRRGIVSAWVNPSDRSIVYSAKAPIVAGWEVTQDRTTVHRAPGDALLVESYGDTLLHMPIDERLITVRPGVFGMTEPMPFGRSSIIRVAGRDDLPPLDGSMGHLRLRPE